jgi:hypothetical protein
MPASFDRRWGADAYRAKPAYGGYVAPADSFDRADLGMLAGFDPDPFYLAYDGSNRVSVMQARYAYTLAGAATTYDVRSSAAAMPLYEATGIFGKPSLYFTTDDFMATADALLANILDGTQAYTAYAVVDRDGVGATDNVWGLGDSASSANAIFHRHSPANDQVRRLAAGTSLWSGSQATGTSPVRETAQYTGAVVNTWVGSSASVVAQADAIAPVCDRVLFGCQRFSGSNSTFLAGRIGMLLIYRLAHDAAQRAYVWGLLQAHYSGLT